MKIIYFAPVEWDSIKQRPQHLAHYLAERHNFYYVQPLGMRKLKLSDYSRVLHRIFSFFKLTRALSTVQIKNPVFIPLMMSNKLMQQLNIWLLARQLRKIADNDTILWVTSPVNIMPVLLTKIRHKALVYEMMDDYAKIHLSVQHEIARVETSLIAKADLVVATSQMLLEKAETIEKDENCVLISNGVDYNFFAETPFRMPAELC
jgi:glycosyltransferase involved in cell wall biosynthesis